MTSLSSLRWSFAEEIVNIQDLNGVGPVTAGKLRDAGYDSIASLAIAPIRELIEKAGLENSVALKISRASRETIQTDFVTAKQLYERRLSLQRLSFASTNLDKLPRRKHQTPSRRLDPLALQRRIHRARIPKRTPTTPKQPPSQTPPNSSSPQPSSRHNKPSSS